MSYPFDAQAHSKMILNRGEVDVLERNRSYQLLSTEEIANGKSTNWPELEIAGTIRNLSPSVWKFTHLTALYLNDNCLKTLPPSISLLVNLKRLDLANNKLRSLPPELGDLTELRELMLSNNLLRSLPYELGRLFQLLALGLKGNQLGPEITSIYNEPNGTRKLLDFMLDSLSVNLSPPPPRPWIQLATLTDRSRPTALFSVLCYNILCERYATRQMYGYCPQWALNWEYRKKGILDEVRHYGADIISLQEVEMEQFYNFFLRELKRDGYEGIFSPKSRAKTMCETERKRVDGCAIFYRTSKFTMLKEHLVEFNQLAASLSQKDAMSSANRNLLNRVMPKDNIALAALLEMKESCWEGTTIPSDPSQVRQQILVCAAHIHWDPEFCDVKLIQTMMLMDQLKRLIEQECKKPPTDVQLLLCGDLNSLPESGVVQFLTEGHISTKHPDFKAYEYCKALSKMLNHALDKDAYTHPFELSSAVTPDIMPFTNYTYDFKGMIDYVFYPKKAMQTYGMLGPLDDHWLKDNKVLGCPQPHLPSDHFSLLVELAMPLPLGSAETLPLPNISPMEASHAAAGGATVAPIGNNDFIGSQGMQQQPLHPHHLQGPPPSAAGAHGGPFGMPSLMNYPPPNSNKLQTGFLR